MTDPVFVHLAVRSSYSLLESMITPSDLAKWGKQHDMPAMAVTDRNCLFGALELSLKLSDYGIQPIMACCFDVTDGAPKSEPSRLSLYAQNETGYKRLMFLSSMAYLEAPDGVPRLHRKHVLEDTDGLILLTGGAEGPPYSQRPDGRRADGTLDAGGRLSGTVLCGDHAPWHAG